MPAAEIKGSTWGPSTVHQRERVNLPELKKVQKRPNFFKSAPNLEKSRAHTSHHELGKSDEALNNRGQYSHNDDYSRFGCFTIFSRGEDSVQKSVAKVKKHSLDSEMPHNNNSLASRGLKGSYSFDEESTNNNVEGRGGKGGSQAWRLQKSLDQLTENISVDFEKQCRLNSKSSDDIFYSSNWDSQFDREDFFSDFTSTDIQSSNIESGDYSIRDDQSSKSSRLDDSISSETGNFDNDFSKNVFHSSSSRFSSRGGSARKGSVTFVDYDSTNELASIEPLFEGGGNQPHVMMARERMQTPPPLRYFDVTSQLVDATAAADTFTVNGKKSNKHRSFKSSLSRIFKSKSKSGSKNKRVRYSESFKRARDSSEMNEQLLHPENYDSFYNTTDRRAVNNSNKKS